MQNCKKYNNCENAAQLGRAISEITVPTIDSESESSDIEARNRALSRQRKLSGEMSSELQEIRKLGRNGASVCLKCPIRQKCERLAF